MNITVDGLHINYTREGQGQAVLILEGWGTSCAVYQSMIDCLKCSYDVICPDLPGFGASEEPPAAWDVSEYTEFVIHFLKALKLREVALIGHSYGGRIIIRMTSVRDLPFVVTRLVLVDSAGIKPVLSGKQQRKIRNYKRLRKLMAWPPIDRIFHRQIENWKSRQGSEDYRKATPVMRQCLVKAVNEDLTELLPSIPYETLLVWGEQDHDTPITDGEKMEQMIPGAGLVRLKGAGHYSFLDQPVIFNRVMKSYFGIKEEN